MAENPIQTLAKACSELSRCVQSHLSRLFLPNYSPPGHLVALESANLAAKSSSSADAGSIALLQSKAEKSAAEPLTKEELGRATWTLLHTIAAQYPDQPTRQQKRDVKELMAIISRLYPCKECADHFKEVLKANPVQAGSQEEFAQYLCHTHNVVNRSIGRVTFPCNRVNARWGKLDCKDRACDVQGTSGYSNKRL